MNAPKVRRRRARRFAWSGDDGPSFEQRGASVTRFSDVYHHLLTTSWTRLILLMAGGFLSFNLLFAGLYLAGGDCFSAPNPGSFLEAFSFSVQTMAAIGYGVMAPTTPYAYLLSNLEGFLGLLSMAMASGLMFAKFSRPTARVVFSDRAVVHDRNGVPTLQFRMSNERGNQIVEAHLSVVALIDRTTAEGDRIRRLIDLPMARERTPMFSLSWVAMHPLDDDSPLRDLVGPDGCDDRLVAIIVGLSGLDDTFSQTVHARHYYQPQDVLWGHRFVDMIETRDDDHIIVHHGRIHDVEEV